MYLDACKILKEQPHRFKNVVKYIGKQKGVRRAEVDDFFQEVFQRLWKNCGQLTAHTEKHLGGIFCKTAKRLAKDYRNKMQNQQVVGLEKEHFECLVADHFESEATKPGPNWDEFGKMLETLPEPKATIMRLKAEGMTFKMIGERLKLSLGGVYDHFVLAIKTLKEKWKHE